MMEYRFSPDSSEPAVCEPRFGDRDLFQPVALIPDEACPSCGVIGEMVWSEDMDSVAMCFACGDGIIVETQADALPAVEISVAGALAPPVERAPPVVETAKERIQREVTKALAAPADPRTSSAFSLAPSIVPSGALKANGFEKHGISRLTPAKLSTFVACPSLWVAENLFGYRRDFGPSLTRSQVVSRAVSDIVNGAALEDACSSALFEFDSSTPKMTDKAKKEREAIERIISQAQMAFANFGEPEIGNFDADRFSKRLELGDGVGIQMSASPDFVFPDQGAVVVLKTGLKMETAMPLSHRRQRAFMASCAAGVAVSFVYVTHTKWRVASEGDVEKTMEEVKFHARRMERLLRLDKESIREIVPLDMTSFYWSDGKAGAEQIFGIPNLDD